MKPKFLFALFLGLTQSTHQSFCQTRSTVNYTDFTVGGAKYQGALALAYVHSWKFGSQGKLGIGLGSRFTSYFAANQHYITAPAQLTSGSTSPLILFQDNISANIDTFLIKSPQTNSINLSINIDYQLIKNLVVGFNIDAIGFSFGGSRTGNYINGATVEMTSAAPTPFNILLISDNDRGSLNSEFFTKYSLDDKWQVKLGAQFLFTEYTTQIKVQKFPQENDRFRNKSLLLCFGVSYKLK